MAFDLVHHESLWEILRLQGIPTRIVGLIANLYTGAESHVKSEARLHPCINTFQHLHALDNGQSYFPKSVWSNSGQYQDLDFADVAILSLKSLDLGGLLEEPVHSIRAFGEDVEVAKSFTYLGSAIYDSELSDQEVSRLLAAGATQSTRVFRGAGIYAGLTCL
ncbi:uncharacterized protein [Penaeus vannamei]|uniref:uncharacterized protein n=1 Tax=Penaeus vannamei TaxID=6689 RepID=UPI00387F7AFC